MSWEPARRQRPRPPCNVGWARTRWLAGSLHVSLPLWLEVLFRHLEQQGVAGIGYKRLELTHPRHASPALSCNF